jgi:hypothetical protein
MSRGTSKGRRRIAAALALLTALLSPGVQAAPRPAAPLFGADTELETTLALPLRTLLAERLQRPEVAAVLTVQGAESAAPLDVTVSTRGQHRLRTCTFPPLRLDFERRQVAGTLFAEQNRLKLVTPCRSGDRYVQYLELEYALYRMYEQVADAAFRVRRTRVRYVDTERGGDATAAPAFFLEPIRGVAARLDMEAVETPRVDLDQLEPAALATLSLFQYVIGNTDWAATGGATGEDCCHNTDVIAPRGGGGLVLVPYDFDHAGIIDAEYATPSEGLGLSSVRQRLYRGFCRTNAQLDAAVARLNGARPGLEEALRGGRLSPGVRGAALRYLERSFAIMNDPQRRQREIVGRCREG